MITLMELIDTTTWLRPQEHMKITLWDKSKIYEPDEFKDIELNVYNLAKYGNYNVSDIDIEYIDDDAYLSCMIWREN